MLPPFTPSSVQHGSAGPESLVFDVSIEKVQMCDHGFLRCSLDVIPLRDVWSAYRDRSIGIKDASEAFPQYWLWSFLSPSKSSPSELHFSTIRISISQTSTLHFLYTLLLIALKYPKKKTLKKTLEVMEGQGTSLPGKHVTWSTSSPYLTQNYL